ncbi:uncharacterized protein BJX67DRAFT_359108 [Aspergillus lucknowensis]|uniref:Uncharacterized protein n=1 Tax=Aspergillus lucknowensis TaxID=176173 RepID=A0ABR4LLD1_9EURO
MEAILRTVGWTDNQIFLAQVRWNQTKIRLLPRWYYSHAREYLNWRFDKLRHIYAVWQRIKYLSPENGEEIYIYNLHPDIRSTTTSIMHTSDASTPTDEEKRLHLRRLRAELRNIQGEMTDAFYREPNNALMWLDWHYLGACEKDGRSRRWHDLRSDCAARGGCCGRTCGCCEKLLFENWLHTPGPNGKRILQKVYAHCTAECACCVISHGVYEPDPRLPRPWFVVESREGNGSTITTSSHI